MISLGSLPFTCMSCSLCKMVPEEGLEPSHALAYGILSPACLPVPTTQAEGSRGPTGALGASEVVGASSASTPTANRSLHSQHIGSKLYSFVTQILPPHPPQFTGTQSMVGMLVLDP